MKVTISLSTGGDEDGDTAEVSFDEDCGHHPDMLSDLLRRGADTALRLYRDLHPAEKETA